MSITARGEDAARRTKQGLDMLRIFIVEDHPIMRSALSSLVGREADFSICGQAVTGEVALERIAGSTADVALLDVSLPGMDGLELVAVMTARFPEIACLMLSGHSERDYIDRALSAGARGYVLKGDVGEVASGIRAVAGGEVYLSAGCG